MENNKLIKLMMVALICILIVFSAYGHGGEPSKPTHQYITNESGQLWKLMPYEIKQHLNRSMYANATDIFYCYDVGEDIISGSGEEDFCGGTPFSGASRKSKNIRALNGTQQLGSFDKVASYGRKRWAFNYITGSESYTYMLNLSPVFYVLEMSNITFSEVTEQVGNLINATK